jgi:signal transduction histidine kinase
MTKPASARSNQPCLAGLCLWLCLLAAAPAAPARDTLTNAAAVLALSGKDALSGVPVSVTGVVTAAEPTATWSGRFFMQDGTGGVFVDSRLSQQPLPGDVVQVSGFSHPGGYAPIITKPHWKKIGTAALPPARPVTSERLMSGAEDGQRVEISGIVRAAEVSGTRIGVELASGGYRFGAYFPPAPGLDPASLVGARIRLRGTAATGFNAPLRHFVTVTLFAPQPDDFFVQEPAPPNPFEDPPVPLNNIAQFRKDPPPGYQVHVTGVVTYQRRGESLFLEDETGGLEIKTKMTNAVARGDFVEAVGFPAVENFLPVLEDAVFRKTTAPRTNLEPKSATIGGIQKGLHHADFIVLRGRLIDRLVKGTGPEVSGSGIQTSLILQASNMVFVAEKETSQDNPFLSAIPIGSLVEVSGICLLDGTSDGKIKSFRLLLPTSYDVRVIERPSRLTPRHLLVSLASVLVVLLVAIGWIIWAAKRNFILASLVQQKEEAQHQLQQAHDLLEDRVRERTAQLKVEMTARKESELQFRAVLTERTRLAQELHDTLEQTLTGIALQQDLAASQFEKSPDHASHHLKLARNLMRQSQEDLHRSVWGLRSRADENFNLPSALLTSARQVTDDTHIRLESAATGDAVSFSEIIEENLLRIGQEAVTNAVKHSGATVIDIQWQFTPGNVVLKISDNGHGFDPNACAGPKDGHFGLLGIRERTERLGGRLQITSQPGSGTSISVEIPTATTDGQTPAPATPVNHEERV